MLDIIDPVTGNVTGQALRSRCHGHPELVHRAAHVMVFHPDGRLLLQKRAMNKQVQPGKWDMSVGGHLSAGDSWEQGVLRELQEELGIKAVISDLKHMFDFELRNDFESENIRVYSLVSEGPFDFQKEEIDAVDFFPLAELRRKVDSGKADDLTPLLRAELELVPGFRP